MTGSLVICTRNRPDDLQRTLRSVESQQTDYPLDVLVVDASDAELRPRVAHVCAGFKRFDLYLVNFDGTPSLARQRNVALDRLRAQTDVVLFIDDDVSLAEDYVRRIMVVFAEEPETVGVGGSVSFDGPPGRRSPLGRLLRRFFLLESGHVGGVTVAGGESRAHLLVRSGRRTVAWLSGSSCAYRMRRVAGLRFDDRLDGYSLDEDLDFSYRAGRLGPLRVEPAARLVHHHSPMNRYQRERYASEYLVHRYWFLEKNVAHPLRKPAFWWATTGRLFLALARRGEESTAVARGLIRGVGVILRRAHPLLRGNQPRRS